MISDFLKQRNKKEVTNIPSGLLSLINEKISIVVPLNEGLNLIVMESGTSISLYSNGTFTLLDKESTDKIVNEYMTKMSPVNDIVNRIKELGIIKEKPKPSKETKQEENKG